MPMLRNPSAKYSPFPQVPLTDRQWPTRTITAPPRWLSTDLRDGNQAIVDPMDAHKIDSRAIYRLSRSEDAKEGIASFLEKRAPAYPDTVSEDMPDFYPWWEQPAYR